MINIQRKATAFQETPPSHLVTVQRHGCAPELLCFLNDAFVGDPCQETRLPSSREKLFCSWLQVGGLTELVLQHPDLQLDEAVGVEAFVLPPAAVAHLVATKIQLALRIQGPDFGIANRVLL